MAKSSAHKLGQLIGNIFEASIKEVLNPIITDRGLYLDYKKERRARGNKKEVMGRDLLGNSHKLDYVIERGGTEDSVGDPIAFVEIAWRRYSKHSKNKAEEIGDVLDVMYRTYSSIHPFKGAILAGVFTGSAISQLKSKGITVAYIDYEKIISQFSGYGLEIAWDEDTLEAELDNKVSELESYISQNEAQIISDMVENNKIEFDNFKSELIKTLERKVSKITIVPHHGESSTFLVSSDAIEFLDAYNELEVKGYNFISYEIFITYKESIGDIKATFTNKIEAKKFIEAVTNI
ncbi:TPA: hypothetical protein U1729_000646 [Streptococcus suis]|nr:DNA methylase [Streptococcus suis]HEM5183773.1 hypothetical protein [Streptococcus suis]HEM5650567.1 hypothetical protein [Streptococcus suis]